MIATTKMSTRGQIVIPEEIREDRELKSGAEFIVISEGDCIVLKEIKSPPRKELKQILDNANKKAKKLGIKKSDISDAIRIARKQK